MENYELVSTEQFSTLAIHLPTRLPIVCVRCYSIVCTNKHIFCVAQN